MSSASTQYCPNCGASNPIDAQSCWNCGQALPTSEERQELWATREADGDPTRGDAASGVASGSSPEGGGPGGSRQWSGAATEPFQTPGPDDPQRIQAPEGGRTGDTRTFPTTWGAPNTPASGRQRDIGGSDVSAEQPTTTTPIGGFSGSGYGPGGASGPRSGTGAGDPGYGPGAYPSWNTGPRDEYAADRPTSGPYGPGGYAQGPYDQAQYGATPPDQAQYGAAPYDPPVTYAGGDGPGGPAMTARTSRGPSGCLLGALGVVLIALVGAVLVAIIAYNAATGDQLRDELRDVAATEVTRTGPVDVPQDGRLTVSEADVNRTIRRYTDDYGAISDPTLAIDPNGVVLNFSVLGIDSAYRAGLVAEGGQLRLTDPKASGAASRVLGADDMVAIVEPSLNDILRQSGVTATGVELGDGQLTVLTAGTSATPGAGTPAATSVPPSAAPSGSGSAVPAASGSAAPSKPRGQLIGIFGSESPSPSSVPSAGPSSTAPSSGSAAPSSSESP